MKFPISNMKYAAMAAAMKVAETFQCRWEEEEAVSLCLGLIQTFLSSSNINLYRLKFFFI